ncbi:hypothetical protein [Bradyrhizobium sp. USDA 3364]
MDGVECVTASKHRWAMLCILLGLGLSGMNAAARYVGWSLGSAFV